MVAEVNKIIAGELLSHRSVAIAGMGTLYVARRSARRLSRRTIAPPRFEVDVRMQEEGVSLVELIRRTAGCDAAQAQAIFDRWLAATRRGEVLTLEGIGVLRYRTFTPEAEFAARLNPAGGEVVTLQPRMNRTVVAIAAAAVVVAAAVFASIGFDPKSRSGFVARSERTQTPRVPAEMPVDAVSAAGAAATEGDASAMDGVSAAAAPSEGMNAEASIQTAPNGEMPAAEASAANRTPAPQASVRNAAADQQTNDAAATPGTAPQEATGRMQSGWSYAVYGVFSTEENARRCREQLLHDTSSLGVGVYAFGAKFMVSPFAASDRAVCEDFVREHRSTWPDLWIYTKK